jgi:hypothetical protein
MYSCSGKGLEAAQSQLTPALPLTLLDGSMDGHAQCSACRAEGPSAHCLRKVPPSLIHHHRLPTNPPEPSPPDIQCHVMLELGRQKPSPALPVHFPSRPAMVDGWTARLPVCDWGLLRH